MTPKQYLSQIGELNERIVHRKSQLKELNENDGVSSIHYEQVSGKTNEIKRSLELLVEKRLDLRLEIEQMIFDMEVLKNKIIGQIEHMGQNPYQQLLYKRYVEDKKLEQIALEMNYSFDRIRHMHGIALKKFGDIFKVSTQ